jgi:hypothetical protein
MNNNIKKICVLTLALATSLALCARPGPGRGFGGPHHPPPMHHGGHHHHHHHHGAYAVGAGILGAGLVASAIYDATHPRPIIVESAPVVVTPAVQPVVVTPAPVVTTGHYETQVQNVWVEGRYIDQTTPQGTIVRVWQHGHYEQQSTQVWVSP